MGGRRRGHSQVTVRKANETESDSMNALVCPLFDMGVKYKSSKNLQNSRPASVWMGYIGMEVVY